MPARKTVTLYVVQSQHWQYNDEWYEPPPDDLRFDDDLGAAPGPDGEWPMPLRTFLSQETAERYRQDLERREREGLSPLHYGEGGNLADYSSLSPAEFLQRLAQAGLDMLPLRRGKIDPRVWEWLSWGMESWNDEQCDAVWEVCDKVRFFKVVSVQVELQTEPADDREFV